MDTQFQVTVKEVNMHPKKEYIICFVLCGTTLLLVIAGIVLLCFWDLFYESIVSSNLILAINSSAYNIWIKNPLPLAFKLYVFNWTNPEDIYNISTKPKFQQLGPYYFSETKEKSSVVWNDNNHTVSYKNLKKWYFEPKLSNGSLSDIATSLDPIALSAVYTTRHWNYFVKASMFMVFRTMVDSVATTRTVGQVLFEGYENNLLQAASKMNMIASFPFKDKFGWFYGRNGSEDYEGVFNVDTGLYGQVGQLYNWKYSNHTSYFPGGCGALENTSGGDFFPRNLKKDSIIKFFSPDMCRSVELEFEKEVEINGVMGYKYSAGDRMLDNGTNIPENKCFCDGECMPYGALNVSACRYGSPGFISLPHFYKADPYYLQNIEGLSPDPKTNDFYMIFEPNTGIPLEVAARLQLNLQLQPISGTKLYENVPEIYFPVIWFEQVITIPESMTFSLKLLANFKLICFSIGTIAIVIGVLIQICIWYKICTTNLFGRKKSKTPKPGKATHQENMPLKGNTK